VENSIFAALQPSQNEHSHEVPRRGTPSQAAEKVTLPDLLQIGETITGPTSDDCEIFDS
jgi:hypothetical protein